MIWDRGVDTDGQKWTRFDSGGIEKLKQLLENQKRQHPSKFWDEKIMFSKKYKDQNDRIGKTYRFEWSWTFFHCKKQLK